MKTPKWLTSVAALFALPSVCAVRNSNRAVQGESEITVRNILKRDPKITVHDIPDEKVNEFLHPLLKGGGGDLVKELILRSKESPQKNRMTTLIRTVVPELDVPGIAEVCIDFVFGPQIKALNLNTKDSSGMTLLMAAVS